ncbi:TlpA family protein disulfide reductase [Nocardioides bruguierae]|uniref:TlpA family protein disulfide reductase n=1 Tax=Nocardioides bruguierae TaxID=2945102 RepID=A0A9X2IED1_9ACTN|nr:TlpA disulfide reductase family protein [Nocardioides bruguierae]MCM0620706.1 TlpA family protein disulfide reductase [Nocardioides bruguierae]
MRRSLAGAAAAVVLLMPLLAACAPSSTGEDDGTATDGQVVDGSSIDVDTRALRAQRAEVGLEDCVPGTGDGAVEGGLPALTLPCLGGGDAVDLADLRGPLVVNFWYSTCGPCRAELPVLAEFHDRHGDDVPLLGVDFNDPLPEAALELLADSDVTYPSVADTDGAVLADDTLRIVGFPTTAFVAADGTVSYVQAGEIESVDELEQLVADHLGVDL